MPQHLKCLATVIYDLPFVTIRVSNWHLFSDMTISQGSVATHLRCGGIFSYHFTVNLSPSPTVKEFWKSVKIWQSYWGKLLATKVWHFSSRWYAFLHMLYFWAFQSCVKTNIVTLGRCSRYVAVMIHSVIAVDVLPIVEWRAELCLAGSNSSQCTECRDVFVWTGAAVTSFKGHFTLSAAQQCINCV